VALRLDPMGLAISGANPRDVLRFKAGRTDDVTWSLCGRGPGSYLVLAQATVNGAMAESSARILRVENGRSSC
jgi:hypothetical protein